MARKNSILELYLDRRQRMLSSPLTAPCVFCNHDVSRDVGNFPADEPRRDFLDFAYNLYSNLFQRFGFHFYLTEEYHKDLRIDNCKSEVEESVWSLSYAYRMYYKTYFAKLLPDLVEHPHRFENQILLFGKKLFREHVCAFKFLVFCGFLSEISAYFHRRDIGNSLSVAPKWLELVFNRYISGQFYPQGGWAKLQKTAELLSEEYRSLQKDIDSDTEIETIYFSRKQIMYVLGIPHLDDTEDIATEDILEVINNNEENTIKMLEDGPATDGSIVLKYSQQSPRVQDGTRQSFKADVQKDLKRRNRKYRAPKKTRSSQCILRRHLGFK